MVAMIVGIVLIAFTVFAAIPGGLAWGADIITFLKGCAPVLTAFIGLIAIFIGIADLKDKKEAKKEEAAARDQESRK
ncbi:hypothetical protein [Treponema brennaborense]|uniref:Uncharacterized protein n=1 Tax=Treponema brennaborense (strain DSM 12168 / CIP 105900 / DD5/3) TaxID=906968 RepID=F4LIH0_TREBD|nr:hypothetical protein [Treponema brennaborense]AEE16211.1 hypothetical protein Trebr_0775 [Treponema brennaborense DSM 12168]